MQQEPKLAQAAQNGCHNLGLLLNLKSEFKYKFLDTLLALRDLGSNARQGRDVELGQAKLIEAAEDSAFKGGVGVHDVLQVLVDHLAFLLAGS